MKGVTHRYYETTEEKIETLADALEKFDALVDTELPIIEKDLELGMTTPATLMDQTGTVALLIGCFPNTNKDDRTIFMQQLTLFLEEFEPTAAQLALAFRWLVRHCKFLPVIAEVREALINADEFMRETKSKLFGDPRVGTDGIRGFRHYAQYLLDDATGETQRKQEAEWERQRIKREQKDRERKIKAVEKARTDAESKYRATKQWAEDTIPKLRCASHLNPERKAELIEQVNIELEKARKKVEIDA